MLRPVLLVVLLAGSALSAQLSTGPASRAPAAAAVTGRVLDADTGTPLKGLNVGTRESGWVETDDDGRYTLRTLPAGRSDVWIQGEFLNVSYTETKAIIVTDGRDITGLDFHVRLFANISGRVTDDRGEPVGGVPVIAVANEYGLTTHGNLEPFANGELMRLPKYRATTNANGEYLLSRVLAGRPYRLLAYSPKRAVRPADTVSEPAARTRALAATYFPRAATFEAATPVIVTSHERREHVDITMSSGPSRCVAVRTMSGGTPLSAFVSVEEAEVSALRALSGSDAQTDTGRSAPDGSLRVCGLAPGPYRVSAAAALSDWYSGTVDVAVRDQDLTGIVVSPEPPVKIFGEIVWAASRPGAPPAPVITISTPPAMLGLRYQELSGSFSAMFQPNVPYTVQVGTNGPTYVRDVTYNGVSILHRSLTVRPATTPGTLRISIGQDPASLRARVNFPNGQPAPNQWVLILSGDAATEAELAGGIVAGWSDENGICQIFSLKPGRYRVLATGIVPPVTIPLPMDRPWIERTPEAMRQLLRAREAGALVELAPNGRGEVAVISRAIR